METDLTLLFSNTLSDVADDVILEDLTQSPPEALPTVNQVRNVEWGDGTGTLCEELKNELIYCLNEHADIYQKVLHGVEQLRVRFVRNLSYTLLTRPESFSMTFIWDIREEIDKRVKNLLALCQNFILSIKNVTDCNQRLQQLHAIGVDTTKEAELRMLFKKEDIPELKKQILNAMSKIYPVIHDAISGYKAGWNTMINYQKSVPHFNPEFQDYQALDFTTYKSEFEKLELSIRVKFSLQVTQQPKPVIQTKMKTSSMKVRLHNFNNVSVDSVQLKGYIISESTAKTIAEADADVDSPPEIHSLAGKVVLAGEATLSEEGEQQQQGLIPGFKTHLTNEISQVSCSNQKGLKLKFPSRSSNPNHWDIEIPFKILEVVRKSNVKLKVGETENSELVAREKYCFLFVSKLPTQMGIENITVWTTSLPFIVTTNSVHAQIASSVMAWDNTFPLPGRSDFGVRKKANLSQLMEMLEGVSKSGTSGVLKPSHVMCLQEKIKEFKNLAHNLEADMTILFPNALNDVADYITTISPPPVAWPIVDQVWNAECGCGCGIKTFGEELKHELTYLLNTHPGIYLKLAFEKEKFRVRFVRDFSCTMLASESLTMKFIGGVRKELDLGVKSLIAICQSFIHCIKNIVNCFQRQQQLLAIGVNTTRERELIVLFKSANIAALKRQILNSIAEITSVIQDAVCIYNTAQGAMLRNQRADLDFNPEDYQRLDFSTYKSEYEKLVLSIHERFSLQVTQQPETVIQTKMQKSSMKVRLHNFNNVSVDSVQLKVYLISESTAKTIIEADAGTSPEIPELAGKLMLAGKAYLSEEEEGLQGHLSGVQRQRTDAISHVTCLSQKSLILKFTSSSCNPKHWDMEIPFKILEVARTNKLKVKAGENESSELPVTEKYCFLFVSELPTEIGNFVKVWTTSLPFVVTTYSGQTEIASGVMAWDNAFPLPGRTDFAVRKDAKLCQFTEMLEGYFKLSVGRVLKPSHVRYLQEKLKEIKGSPSLDILWTEIMRDDRGPSFWCWFYRTTLILNCHLKSLWDAGYFKAFISFETAAKLLIDNNANPGLFLIRFSDNEAGAVSIVFMSNDYTVNRLWPIEFYAHKSAEHASLELLRNLNAKDFGSGADVLRWVFTEGNTRVEKKTAFEEFYKYAEKSKLCQHYSTIFQNGSN